MQLKSKQLVTIDAKGMKIGIAVSRFNSEITEKLVESAQNALQKNGVAAKDIRIVSVPGAVEIPFALQQLAKTKKFDCLVALGCVIRGDTPHFDYVCKMAQEGVLKVSLDNHIPIGFGVLTLNTIKQAKARFSVGGDAAMAAIELVRL